jgi:hypothetical protein
LPRADEHAPARGAVTAISTLTSWFMRRLRDP